MENLDNFTIEKTTTPLLNIDGNKKFVIISTVFFMLSYLFMIYGVFSLMNDTQFGLVSDITNRNSHILILISAYFVYLIAFILIAVSVSIFYYRAYKNLVHAGITNLTFSPGMAVGGWFIPFANIVLPYLVTRDLWKGSKAIEMNDVNNWKNHKLSIMINFWYFGAIVMGIIVMVYYVSSLVPLIMETNSMNGYSSNYNPMEQVQKIVSIAKNVLLLGSFAMIMHFCLFIFIINKIAKMQKTK